MSDGNMYWQTKNNRLPDPNTPASPMDVKDHPAYNVPEATEHHRGSTYGASLSDMSDRGATRAPLEEAMPVTPQGTSD